MTRLAKFLATVGGLGYVPLAPGTAGSLAGLILGLLWPAPASWLIRTILLVGGFLLGVFVSTITERALKIHDPGCVVIDEAWAMWALMWLMPAANARSPWFFVIAFVLFRVFDIAKPPPLTWLAKFPRGWGIMLDDLGAAAYTCLLLWAVLRI